jgi:hypothetical protein
MSGAKSANDFEVTEIVVALKCRTMKMRQAVCRVALVRESMLMLKWIDPMDT